MDQASTVTSGDEGVAVGLLDAQTPYQITLAGLRAPPAALLAFNVLGGIALWPIAGALAAAAAALLGGAADLLLQGLYARWRRTAADENSDRGLKRLGACAAARSALWMSFPTVAVLTTHSPAAYAYSALVGLSMVAIAVSAGWISRAVWAGWSAPAAAALALQTAPLATRLELVTIVAGLAVFAGTAILIALGTARKLSKWSRANERTRAVLRQLQSTLARSEAAERRLRIAVDIADLHVFELDYRNRTFVSIGSEASFYERPPSYEDVAQDPFVVVAPEDRARVLEVFERHRAGLAPYRTEYRVNRADGREVWASAAAEVSFGDDGRVQRFVGVAHNITHLKRAERDLMEARDRAEAASRAKSEFLATMSHEIRTPLNGVLGMAQAMAHEELSPEQAARLDVIRASGETLLALLDSILDLSRIEAGRLELEQGEVDLVSQVRAAAAGFGREAATKGLDLRLAIKPDAAGRYAGDPIRVSQLLTNLIDNAVKFTERGFVEVALDTTASGVRISVADSGIGIAPDQQAALFEKFIQGDASITRRFGGSGLGLAICRELVRLMGGEIRLESAAGAGSRFTVDLPLVRLRSSHAADTTLAPAPPAALEDEAETEVPLRVLAAEDNEVNRLVLTTLLQPFGLDLTVVENGGEAVHAWQGADWDLILMDIRMPVMDGIEATRRIRAAEAQSGREATPIIAVTANVMNHQLAEYRAAGIQEVVGKPLALEQLLQAMERVLARSDGAAVAASAC